MAGIKMVACESGSICPSPVKVNPDGPNYRITRLGRKRDGWMDGRRRGLAQVQDENSIVVAARHNGGLIPGMITPGNTTCLIPWGSQAIAKTEYYMLSNPGNVGVVWQQASNGQVPRGALQGGHSETGEKLYIGRFRHGRMYLGGKVHPSHGVCYVPCGTQEISSRNYEVLCLSTVPLANLGL